MEIISGASPPPPFCAFTKGEQRQTDKTSKRNFFMTNRLFVVLFVTNVCIVLVRWSIRQHRESYKCLNNFLEINVLKNARKPKSYTPPPHQQDNTEYVGYQRITPLPHYCHNRAFRKIIPLLKEHTPPFRASGYALPVGVF